MRGFHGHTSSLPGVPHWSPEYSSWIAMKTRCGNPNYPHYVNITIHEPWRKSFEAFLRDMGPKPTPKHTIDRIDGSLGYHPGNCRWATMDEQASNRCNNRFPGTTMQRVAEEAGITLRALKYRIKMGWPEERWFDPVMKRRETQPIGDDAPGSKLTSEIVKEIRKSTKKTSELAREYGVSHSAICSAKKRLTWRHIP